MKAQKKIPNNKRAICNGKIATIHNGRRVVRVYKSGEPLVGRLPEDDAPPFTGYVRGWFQEGGCNV